MLVGKCETGCDSVYQINYEYRLYQRWKISEFDNDEIWILVNFQKFYSVLGNIRYFHHSCKGNKLKNKYSSI